MHRVKSQTLDARHWSSFAAARTTKVSGLSVDKLGADCERLGEFCTNVVCNFCGWGKTMVLRTIFTRVLRCLFHRDIRALTSVLGYDFHILHRPNNKSYKLIYFINY